MVVVNSESAHRNHMTELSPNGLAILRLREKEALVELLQLLKPTNTLRSIREKFPVYADHPAALARMEIPESVSFSLFMRQPASASCRNYSYSSS